MKKLILAIFTAGIAVSCTTVKNTTAKVERGNYDDAIEVTLSKLRKNPEKKRKQEYVLLLEEAYNKAVQRDTDRIQTLTSNGNKVHLQEIYDLYLGLRKRQEHIQVVAPLRVIQENRFAHLPMTDYSLAINTTRDALADHLYASAQNFINSAQSKEDYREVYYDLAHLDGIKKNFKNVRSMMQTAHDNGTAYIQVSLYNDSQIALPRMLERDLLDFSSYGLDDFWTVYHSNIETDVAYDFTIEVAFTEINITPEFVKERTFRTEKVIADGVSYLKDDDGNFILDEDGNKIEIENLVTVRARYFEYSQNKAVNVVGRVRYSDATTGQVLDSFPLSSEFIFDNVYARYRGDARALNPDLLVLTTNRHLPFPTNEQMIYDAGRDLKDRLKSIISKA